MGNIDKISLVTGLVFIIGGLILLITPISLLKRIIYSIPLFIIGVIILITLKQQEHIEKIIYRKR